jgi:hypothetical protein
MTAPSAPGVALYEGVTVSLGQLERWINAMGDWDRGGKDAMDEMQDMLDAATTPPPEAAPTPAPDWEAGDGWGEWRTDIDVWNTATHDVQHECIDGIHRTRLRVRSCARPLDEVFDTPAEVERNPFGAWQAIQELSERLAAMKEGQP